MNNQQLMNNRYRWVVYGGFILIFIAAAWITIQNEGRIKFSADHDMTMPFWHNWIITGVLLLLILFLPGSSSDNNPFTSEDRKVLVTQSIILATLAVLLFIGLLLVPGNDLSIYLPIFIILLLFTAPVTMFSIYKEKRVKNNILSNHSYLTGNQWLYPMIIMVVWMILYFFSPLGTPEGPEYEMDLIVLIIGASFTFLMHSVLEELFYRVWLQTRLEVLLGTWPAIMISSLLWAIWHMSIQGGGSADIAFSNVIVNQGVTGLFLGFLWAKYRNVWVLIIIHGLINFPLQILGGLL